MTRYIPVIILALFLGACTTDAARNVAIACQGYASVLTNLAVAKSRGQLSQTQIETVDSFRPGLNAICLDGDYNDPMASAETIHAAMLQLLLIEGEIQ